MTFSNTIGLCKVQIEAGSDLPFIIKSYSCHDTFLLFKDLKHEKEAGEVKAKMSCLTNNYVNAYKPSKNTLSKHKIFLKN